VQEKPALVRRTYEPGMSVSLVARQEGVAASLLFQWRRLEREGALVAVSAGESVVLASDWPLHGPRSPSSNAFWAEDLGERDPQGSGGDCRRKKVDCALHERDLIDLLHLQNWHSIVRSTSTRGPLITSPARSSRCRDSAVLGLRRRQAW
jgi:Transposase